MAGKNLLSTPSWDKKTGINKYLQNDQKLREKFGWGKKAKSPYSGKGPATA